jgi:hypothetical protein
LEHFFIGRECLQALVRLKNRFKGSPFGEPTDDEAKWFLRDRGFEVEEAYSKLATCLRWRKQFGLQNVTFESVKKEAASGKVYLHEFCDVYGRPVLVIRVARWASCVNIQEHQALWFLINISCEDLQVLTNNCLSLLNIFVASHAIERTQGQLMPNHISGSNVV